MRFIDCDTYQMLSKRTTFIANYTKEKYGSMVQKYFGETRIIEKLLASTCFHTLGFAAIIFDVSATTDIPCFFIH